MGATRLHFLRSRPHPPLRPHSRLRGVAMVTVLLLLLVITGLTIFSARYATLGEGMARNQLDAERARQAAESALRDAERDLMLTAAAPPAGALCSRAGVRPVFREFSAFTPTCTGGQCATPEEAYTQSDFITKANAEPWWPEGSGGRWNNDFDNKPRGSAANCNFDGGVPLGTYTGAAPLAGVARQPEYLIEMVRRASGRLVFFRITARGFGSSERTQVVLQSYFQPFNLQ
jgi:type IV pilus assembly protein PilX